MSKITVEHTPPAFKPAEPVGIGPAVWPRGQGIDHPTPTLAEQAAAKAKESK